MLLTEIRPGRMLCSALLWACAAGLMIYGCVYKTGDGHVLWAGVTIGAILLLPSIGVAWVALRWWWAIQRTILRGPNG